MALIAAFGMYDRAETAGANDRLWALVRDALRSSGQPAPDALTRGDRAYMTGWLSPDLLIAQTCSLPFRAKLADRVHLIATPDYGLAGCAAGYYRSVYVARKDDCFAGIEDAQGLDFAYNEAMSHSGWAAPHADHAARGLVLRPALRTRAHRASAQAVASGRADYAAIDALTWEMIQSYDSFARDLQAIDYTPPSLALPFISAKGFYAPPLRAALATAIDALQPGDRAALHLRALVSVPASAYLALPIPPTPAQI